MLQQSVNGQLSSPYEVLERALASQRCLVLDGGVATELPHRHGQDDERLWSLEALASSPEVVRDVHRRYVAAGASIITTNTWGLATAVASEEPIVDELGRSLPWTEVARRGVRIAREAISQEDRERACAVAFSINGDIDCPDGIETVSLLARALASGPPDLFILETLSVVRPSLLAVVEAMVGTGLPVWLSFRRCRHGLCGVYGQHWGGPEGDAFGRAARRFEEMGVAALLVNCVPPDHVDGMVSYLRDFTDLPLGVYPNLGYYTSDGWRFLAGVGGERYAELAQRWRAEGAQIIGGCCGTRPEHIAAIRAALDGTRPGSERRRPAVHKPAMGVNGDARAGPPGVWTDRHRRAVNPLSFPHITQHADVSGPIAGTALLWRHLFEQGIGAHQRCLDVGCGTGLLAAQLALNGADHVHAIDIDTRAVANTLDNAFRNGVAERVSGETVDLYPWVPKERYEIVVANLPQIPIDPATVLSSHRPADYWGRGLVDQLISKLPESLATEGVALVTVTSILSRARTAELLDAHGLRADIVGWELVSAPATTQWNEEHIAQIERFSDAFRVSAGAKQLLVAYVLAIRHAEPGPSTQTPGDAVLREAFDVDLG